MDKSINATCPLCGAMIEIECELSDSCYHAIGVIVETRTCGCEIPDEAFNALITSAETEANR